MTYQGSYADLPLRRGMAIASLVLGILAFFCLGPLTGAPAVILGIMATVRANKDPMQYGAKGVAVAGVVTGAIGSVVGWAIVGLLVGVAWPAAMQARGLAMRTADMASLKMLTTGCMMYAGDYAGAYPPTLAELSPYGITPKQLVSRSSKTEPAGSMSDPDLMDHCDYVYVGADLDVPRMGSSSDVIVAYSKDVYRDHARVIIFADGHVEPVRSGDLIAAFDRSNRARGASGLPPVTLDGPPPARVTATMVPKAPGLATPPHPTVVTPVTPVETSRFSSVDAAVKALTDQSLDQRRAAAAYLESAPLEEAKQAEVTREAIRLLTDRDVRRSAAAVIKRWACRENVKDLAEALPKVGDAGRPDGSFERNQIIQTLAGLKDPAAIPALAAMVPSSFQRYEAIRALLALGPEGEKALHPFLEGSDKLTAHTVCRELGRNGTALSLPVLETARGSKDRLMATSAETAIRAIQSRSGK